MDPRAVAVIGRLIADRTPAIARAAWRFAAQDKVIGVWTIVLAAVIVARAGRGVVVTLGGLLVVVTPAYAALFWLIHDHQREKDRTDAHERELDHSTPSTGRHSR